MVEAAEKVLELMGRSPEVRREGAIRVCIVLGVWHWNFANAVEAADKVPELMNRTPELSSRTLKLSLFLIPAISKCDTCPLRPSQLTCSLPSACLSLQVSASGSLIPTTFSGRIEFRDVTFRYPARPEQPVLRGLSLVVNPGGCCMLFKEGYLKLMAGATATLPTLNNQCCKACRWCLFQVRAYFSWSLAY